MGLIRRVLCVEWLTDFLQYILDRDAESTTLIICATRDSFLEQLAATAQAQLMGTPGRHYLLTKTIGLLSKSSKIRLVFCPTLEHLRAYLPSGISIKTSVTGEGKKSAPLIAVLGPISLHLATPEFSAQGLSRTLANAVEASSREDMDLVLCECQDGLDPANNNHGEALWYIDVPLLNASQRVGLDGNTWTGRTVPVKRIAERWFEFTELSQIRSTTETMTSDMG